MIRVHFGVVAIAGAAALTAVGCGDTGVAAAGKPSAQRVGAFGEPARLAVGPDGSRSAVALQNPSRIKRRRVVLWHAKPRSRFGSAQVITRSGKTSRPFAADVAADGSGLAALGGVRSGQPITVVSFDADGRTNSPVAVSATGDLDGRLVDVADSGAALVVWTDPDRGLLAAIRDPGTATFGAPLKLADAYEGSGVTATIGDDGTVVAAWTTGDGGSLEGAVRPPGAAFTRPVTLDQSGADTFPVSGTGGKGLLVWLRLAFDKAGRGYNALYAAPTDATGVGRPYRLLSTRSDMLGSASDPSGPTQIAATMAADGSAIVGFPYSRQRRVPFNQKRGQLAVFAGAPRRLRRVGTLGRSKHGYPIEPKITIGPDNAPVMAWIARDARTYRGRVVTARASAGTTRFARPRRRSSVGYHSLLGLRSTAGGTGLIEAVGPDCEKPGECKLVVRKLSGP